MAKGTISIMGRSGHALKEWDTDKDPKSFDRAAEELLSYTRQGYVAFNDQGEGKGERIQKLTRDCEKVVLVPMAVVG